MGRIPFFLILSLFSSLCFGMTYDCAVTISPGIQCSGYDFGNKIVSATVDTDDTLFKNESQNNGGEFLFSAGFLWPDPDNINRECNASGADTHPWYSFYVKETQGDQLQIVINAAVETTSTKVITTPKQIVSSTAIGSSSVMATSVDPVWGKLTLTLSCVKP